MRSRFLLRGPLFWETFGDFADELRSTNFQDAGWHSLWPGGEPLRRRSVRAAELSRWSWRYVVRAESDDAFRVAGGAPCGPAIACWLPQERGKICGRCCESGYSFRKRLQNSGLAARAGRFPELLMACCNSTSGEDCFGGSGLPGGGRFGRWRQWVLILFILRWGPDRPVKKKPPRKEREWKSCT